MLKKLIFAIKSVINLLKTENNLEFLLKNYKQIERKALKFAV